MPSAQTIERREMKQQIAKLTVDIVARDAKIENLRRTIARMMRKKTARVGNG